MPATLTIRDQTLTPDGDDHVFNLEFPRESITVRELIRERVYQEVEDYNRSPAVTHSFRGLVQPGKPERELNGPRGRAGEVDWKEQFEVATEAFQKRGIVVLIGDRQAESLDETIEIKDGTEVTFLRLVMLVGG